jgi:hypothetical protein
MTRDEVLDLYVKERQYEEKVFGRYSEIKSLNVASFLQFLKRYINEADQAYSDAWSQNLPEWLETCNEFALNNSAPVKVYEALIKIMALSGAALETYCIIDPDLWRADEKIKQKWIKERSISNDE